MKWEDRAGFNHLAAYLRELYAVDVKVEGNLYIGITLDWHYNEGYINLLIPGYIEKALKGFEIAEALIPILTLHAWNAPKYGQQVQLTNPANGTPALKPSQKRAYRRL